VDDWKLKYVNNVFLEKEEIEELNRSIERSESISGDIGIFFGCRNEEGGEGTDHTWASPC
jgi:hypothetical protein